MCSPDKGYWGNLLQRRAGAAYPLASSSTALEHAIFWLLSPYISVAASPCSKQVSFQFLSAVKMMNSWSLAVLRTDGAVPQTWKQSRSETLTSSVWSWRTLTCDISGQMFSLLWPCKVLRSVLLQVTCTSQGSPKYTAGVKYGLWLLSTFTHLHFNTKAQHAFNRRQRWQTLKTSRQGVDFFWKAANYFEDSIHLLCSQDKCFMNLNTLEALNLLYLLYNNNFKTN